MDDKKILDNNKPEKMNEFSNGDFEDNFEEYSNFEKVTDELAEKEIIDTREIIKDEFVVKKSKKGLVLTIILIIIVSLCAFFVFSHMVSDNKVYNTVGDVYIEIINPKKGPGQEGNTEKYNNLGYANVSGKTIGDVCKEEDINFDDFIKKYGLPSDMTEDTYYDVAVYMMPIVIRAEIEQTDFETLKKKFNIPDFIEIDITSNKLTDKLKSFFSGPQYVKQRIEVTEYIPWGLVYDELTLGDIFDGNFEKLKSEYNFGDEITLYTKMKDVRHIMENVQIQERKKKENSEEVTTQKGMGEITQEVVPEENSQEISESSEEMIEEPSEEVTEEIPETVEETTEVVQEEITE